MLVGFALLEFDTPAQSQHQLKAAVLGNFAKFVDWPESAFASADAPVEIAIFGRDPFGPDIETILEPMKAKGRPFVIKRSGEITELASSHILFVPGDETDRFLQVRARLKSLPILTVGEDPRFLQAGGMVNFHLEDRKVRFAINFPPVQEAGLSINPQLLRLASSVQRKDDK